ncbi:hypothetical protein DFS34DRAFT_35424 [Phlyctochytrium arcticum]|nr:hypothetical protein DFS34DRAFT_35424 [Phlyctochytrium arcticum]
MLRNDWIPYVACFWDFYNCAKSSCVCLAEFSRISNRSAMAQSKTPSVQATAGLTDACCNTPPVQASYTPLGQTTNLDDMALYTAAPPSTSDTALIMIYDIFGFHPNLFQAADILAKSTQDLAPAPHVIAPDFYLGHPFPVESVADSGKLMAWIGEKSSYPVIKPTLIHTIDHLKSRGVTKVAFLGFCMEAKLAITAAKDQDVRNLVQVKGVVQIHPTFPADEDYADLGCPVAILPSKDEVDLICIPSFEVAHTDHAESVHHRFDDMSHGFCAARGDWSDPLVAQRATEALNIATQFLRNVL